MHRPGPPGTPATAPARRLALQGAAAALAGWLLPGCAGVGGGVDGGVGLGAGDGQAPADSAADSAAERAADSPAQPLLRHWRSLAGGFLAPPVLQPGQPLRPGTGMFVKWLAPTALALRGQDLLVLDSGSSRLWRTDLVANTVSGIAGAPTQPGTLLALGPDGAAWVLDAQARQVLRFGRDGRLLQTLRIGTALPSPVALALADGGLTALVGDGMGAQWGELRGAMALGPPVSPADAAGRRISGVDALAVRPASGAGPEQLWLLDRLAGAVHQVQRDGRLLQTLGRGELLQPAALGVDRWGRVFVTDRNGMALVCLQAGRPAQQLAPEALRVRQVSAIAVDADLLAIADTVAGQVVLHRLGRPEAA